MSAGDQVLELIRAGESPRVEFKSSLRFDLREQKVNRELTKAAVKTIAGFMNSEGGSLLIGVTDDQKLVGIERDIETLPKKTLDGFELSLRTAIANFLGGHNSPAVEVLFVQIEGKQIARVKVDPAAEPVMFTDGDRCEFYVRDGNLTRPLKPDEQYNYTKRHFQAESESQREILVRQVVSEVLAQQGRTREQGVGNVSKWVHRIISLFRVSGTEATALHSEAVGELGEATEPSLAPRRVWPESTRLPPWLTVRTRNVLDAYLYALQQSTDWKRLHIISPWLSMLDESFSLSSAALADRLKKYGTTVYVVTRPPADPWHHEAIDSLAATGRANIAVVPDLHTKLYVASTAVTSFALIGSANFTQNSADNLEIGLLAHSYMEGKQVVTALNREAADVYRTPGRKLIHRARF